MMALKRSETKSAVVRLEDDSTYMAEVQRLEELRQRIRRTQASIEAIDATETEANVTLKDWLDADERADDETTLGTASRLHQMRRILGERLRREVLQVSRVADAARAAGVAVRRSRLAEHREIVARISAGFDQIAAALADETAFREALDRDGIDFGAPLRPAACPWIGNAGDGFEKITRWQTEMAGY